jgi:hypothetical protein
MGRHLPNKEKDTVQDETRKHNLGPSVDRWPLFLLVCESGGTL